MDYIGSRYLVAGTDLQCNTAGMGGRTFLPVRSTLNIRKSVTGPGRIHTI